MLGGEAGEEIDDAIQALEKAISLNPETSGILATEPKFDKLRQDLRFSLLFIDSAEEEN